MCVLRSNSVTVCPRLLSSAAAARPAGPEPTTATVWPVRYAGCSGTIQPSSNARSAIDCSTRRRSAAYDPNSGWSDT